MVPSQWACPVGGSFSDLELRTVAVIGAAVLNVFVPDLMATESTASDVGSGIRFKPSP